MHLCVFMTVSAGDPMARRSVVFQLDDSFPRRRKHGREREKVSKRERVREMRTPVAMET